MTRLHGLPLLCALVCSSPLSAQSLLDRPPNVSGDWIAPSGTVQFNFLHRFVRSDAPERKITSFPTFVIGAGLPHRTQLGFLYATNSTLVARYPNEWEFYGRWLPLSQDAGSPVDLGGQLGYNLAAKGVDGEISVARTFARGKVRLIGVTRLLDDPNESGKADVALGGGAVVRLQRYIALAGDLVTLTERNSQLGEKAAWSAGLHLAIPGTPHTFSLQATNTNTATLEGSSRGSSQRRYGFEFTIPFTLSRYFGHRQPAPPPAAAPPAPAGDTTRARSVRSMSANIKSLSFQPGKIEITPGTTVTWTNNDPLQHSVTAVDRSFDSGLIAPGGSWTYTFTRPGTYQFSCQPHPFMKGVVIVKEVP